MSQKITHTVGGIAVALGLGAGCGGTQPEPAHAPDTHEVSAAIAQGMERLRTLAIVDAQSLVLNLPAEATACYGLPCPGSGWQASYDAERARQAGRLEKLVTLAEATASNAYLPPHAASEAQGAVAALKSLGVVQVAGLVEAKPANNPSCYSLPCPEDVAAAEHENARRVTVAFGIADAAKRAGL